MVQVWEFVSFFPLFTKACCRGYREHLIWCNSPESGLGSTEGCRWWVKSPIGTLGTCQNQTCPACVLRLVFAGLLMAGGFRFPGSENARPNFLPRRQLRHGHQTSKELRHFGVGIPLSSQHLACWTITMTKEDY